MENISKYHINLKKFLIFKALIMNLFFCDFHLIRLYFFFLFNSYVHIDSNVIRPTKAHQFIAMLEKKGLLLKLFTQNIDMLEKAAGISEEKSMIFFYYYYS